MTSFSDFNLEFRSSDQHRHQYLEKRMHFIKKSLKSKANVIFEGTIDDIADFVDYL